MAGSGLLRLHKSPAKAGSAASGNVPAASEQMQNLLLSHLSSGGATICPPVPTRTLSGNLEKINEHGNRADAIVRSMLEHSRGSSGERRSLNLNTRVDEAMNLAYHGAGALDQSFNITLQRDFDEAITPIIEAPQDATRVLL